MDALLYKRQMDMATTVGSNEVRLGELQGAFKPSPPVPQKHWNHMPMFLPTMTQGREIVSITTRKKFLDAEIGTWRMWHMYRAAAVALGVLALLLLQYSVFLAAFAGAAAGYTYGGLWKEKDHSITILKRRDLLWTK